MKAITSLNTEECEFYRKMYLNLMDCIKDKNKADLFGYKKHYRYAHYTFEGWYTEQLCQCLGDRVPLPEEIIMLVDGGFSHFGASCTVDTQTFRGRVNTD